MVRASAGHRVVCRISHSVGVGHQTRTQRITAHRNYHRKVVARDGVTIDETLNVLGRSGKLVSNGVLNLIGCRSRKHNMGETPHQCISTTVGVGIVVYDVTSAVVVSHIVGAVDNQGRSVCRRGVDGVATAVDHHRQCGSRERRAHIIALYGVAGGHISREAELWRIDSVDVVPGVLLSVDGVGIGVGNHTAGVVKVDREGGVRIFAAIPHTVLRYTHTAVVDDRILSGGRHRSLSQTVHNAAAVGGCLEHVGTHVADIVPVILMSVAVSIAVVIRHITRIMGIECRSTTYRVGHYHVAAGVGQRIG